MYNLKLWYAALAAAIFLHAGNACAATMTFEPANGVLTATTWTEAGMVATGFFEAVTPPNPSHTLSENLTLGVVTPGSVGLLSGGDGLGPGHPNSIVIFATTVPGTTFNLISMDFSGGGNTSFKGFDIHGNLIPGAGIILNGLAAHITFGSVWQNLGSVSYNSIEITTFANINGIDNLVFNVNPVAGETPLPAALPLFASGVAVVTLIARRRRQRLA